MLKKVTLQEQAYDYLKKAILDGSLAPDVNHSETSFGEMLGISRTPVREAIFKLRQEGFLESIPGCGFRVKKLSTQDIKDFYEMRSAVEAYCAFMLADKCETKKTIQLISQLKELLSIQKKVLSSCRNASNLSIDEYVDSDDKFHALIVESSGNRQFIEILGTMRARTRFLAKRSLLVEDRLEEAYREHSAVLEYIEKGEASQAFQGIVRHLIKANAINADLSLKN